MPPWRIQHEPHTCSVIANFDVECIVRAKKHQLTWQKLVEDQRREKARRYSVYVLARCIVLIWSKSFSLWQLRNPDCDNSADMKWKSNRLAGSWLSRMPLIRKNWFCRYVTRRPWWYPRIRWGASLDGASYVLSIPLLEMKWNNVDKNQG